MHESRKLQREGITARRSFPRREGATATSNLAAVQNGSVAVG